MNRLDLDFLSYPPPRRERWLILALGTLALWMATDALFTTQDDINAMNKQLTEAILARQDKTAPSKQDTARDKTVREANTWATSVAQALRYPWQQVLREMEAVHGEGVLLKAFEHAQAPPHTTLTLTVDTSARFQEILTRLKETSGGDYPWMIETVTAEPQGFHLTVTGRKQH